MPSTRQRPTRNDSGEDIRRPKRQEKKPPLNEREKRRLVRYFEQRTERLQVVKTTRTPMGQVLDWIPIESQHQRKIAAPPPPFEIKLSARGERREGVTKFELEDPEVERGPSGTVPIVRKNLKALRFDKTLEELLSKYGHKTRTLWLDGKHAIQQPEQGGPHDYAFTGQNVTCYGGDGYISAYDPYTWYSDEFSLGQIGLARQSANGLQTVEAGHQEYRDLYGDWVPHLFVYYTTNGYSKNGDNVGGYNRDVNGWVQYSGSIYPGALSKPTSTPGGAQYVMHIKYQLYQGNWWLACNGNWIGYYPASLFRTDGLRSQASSIAFFGEIVDSSAHNDATHTDMGSGYWAENRWPYSGYMHNLSYQSGQNGSLKQYNADSIWATDSKEYDIEAHMNSGSTWASYFWFGGPGAG